MAKRGAASGMTRPEKILGGVVLAVYLFVLPLAAEPLFDMIQTAFSVPLGADLRNAIRYYILFALVMIAFGGYSGRELRTFFDRMPGVLGTVGLGLIAFYGLNEILWRVLRFVSVPQANLNDEAILARLGTSPHSTVLIVVFLAPVIEEVLFRGYIFGNLRTYSRAAAYLASSLLFALLHVAPYIGGNWSLAALLTAAQYLVPALVMAWTFERSGSVWGSILLHCAVNGAAVWSVL